MRSTFSSRDYPPLPHASIYSSGEMSHVIRWGTEASVWSEKIKAIHNSTNLHTCMRFLYFHILIKLTFFQDEDAQLSVAVLTSFYRHMCYLTEELVVLALADPGVSNDVKSQMVASMMAAGRPQHFPPGKPTLKPEVLQLWARGPGCYFTSTILISNGCTSLLRIGSIMRNTVSSSIMSRT